MRTFLECPEDIFLTQLVREPTREGALLDLLFVSREGLVGDKVVGACLGHSDLEKTEVLILAEVRRGARKTTTLGLQSVDFGLFGTLFWRVPWEAVLKSKSPGRLWVPQKGTLKGAGAGCPRVLKDEPCGKKNSLAEQRAVTRIQGGVGKSVSHLEVGAGSSGELQECFVFTQGKN